MAGKAKGRSPGRTGPEQAVSTEQSTLSRLFSGPVTDPAQKTADELLSWSVHLMPRRPVASALVLTGIVAMAAIVHSIYHAPLMTLVIVVLLVATLSQFLFPNHYRLTTWGVHHTNFLTAQAKPWSAFVARVDYGDAVLLAFDQRELRNRVNKGYLLHFAGNRDQVLEIVDRYVSKPVEKAP